MANGDLEDFANRIRQTALRLVMNVNKVKQKAAVAIDAEIVMQTPVDTGRARSNWQASLDAPASDVLEAYAPGEKGSTDGANAQAAMEQAKGVIAGAAIGQVINITNNLAYIGRLNDGWSAQAPAGFVQAAVLAGVSAVRAAGSLLSVDIQGV